MTHILDLSTYEYPAYCKTKKPQQTVGDRHVQGHIDGRLTREAVGGIEAAREFVDSLCPDCLSEWDHRIDTGRLERAEALMGASRVADVTQIAMFPEMNP